VAAKPLTAWPRRGRRGTAAGNHRRPGRPGWPVRRQSPWHAAHGAPDPSPQGSALAPHHGAWGPRAGL